VSRSLTAHRPGFAALRWGSTTDVSDENRDLITGTEPKPATRADTGRSRRLRLWLNWVMALISFFTASRRWGIVVPLGGWALLIADIFILATTVRH
jgi:hypothetical protein